MIKDCLRYDPEEGLLYWKRSPSPFSRIGFDRAAGSIQSNGYRQIKINRHRLWVHRVSWFLYYNEWPLTHIDHIDRDPLNNRIENLREANFSQNAANKIIAGREGLKGVEFRKKSSVNPYRARIRVNGSVINLGAFKTSLQAAQAYDAAAMKYFGEFARLNYPREIST